jgi:hypothetical protein
MSKRWIAPVTALFAAAALAACGSSPSGSDFPGGQGRGRSPTGENGNGTFGDGDPNNPNGTNNRPTCATSAAEGAALPVYLVFMYDRSGSMDDNNKWGSARTAMDSFFGSAAAKNMNASLAFFPQSSCGVNEYAQPVVPMRALPDPAFGGALASTAPNGGTPTLPAVQGAIQYAQSIQSGLTNGGKVAVVLVTDGEPSGCGSSPQSVAAAAAVAASTIPTYVIGVGNSLANLNTIAQGGGTKQAILVSDSNPTQTTADLEKALGQIKNALACEYGIPAPPGGEQLDFNAVNLVFTPTGGQSDTLTYNKDCTGGVGWHYDNANQPSKILICQSSCDSIKAANGAGKVEIQFGCATKGGVAK